MTMITILNPPKHPKPKPKPETGLHPGMEVICIDDTGWLRHRSRIFQPLSPTKGQRYTIAEYRRFGGIGAVSLTGQNPDHFYRASRFRRA